MSPEKQQRLPPSPENGFRKPPARRLGAPGHRLLWPPCWAGRPRAAAAQQAPENGELATATRLPEGRGRRRCGAQMEAPRSEVGDSRPLRSCS